MIAYTTSNKKIYYLCKDAEFYFSTNKNESNLTVLRCGNFCTEDENGEPVLKSRKGKIIGRLRK